jgi:hypothetical protein
MALTKIIGEGIGTVDSAVVDNITIDGNDISSTNSDGDIIFKGNDGGSTIEAARFDMSLAGMFLLGKTASATDTKGIELHNTGSIVATVNDGNILFVNRQNTVGSIVEFRQGNTNTGRIVAPDASNRDIVLTSARGMGIRVSDQELFPTDGDGALRDDACDLGHPSARWDDVRATNGTIQTSDRNEKQDIEELSDAEKRVAVVAKGLMRKFRWKDKVAEKGDDARTHFGIIAEGLDASKYAMFCSDTWWYVDEKFTDDDGKEQTRTITYLSEEEAPKDAIKKTRLGVRYSELLAFIISAI